MRTDAGEPGPWDQAIIGRMGKSNFPPPDVGLRDPGPYRCFGSSRGHLMLVTDSSRIGVPA